MNSFDVWVHWCKNGKETVLPRGSCKVCGEVDNFD